MLTARSFFSTNYEDLTPVASRGRLKELCRMAGLGKPVITMLEPEPSYGRAHAMLFYPFMIYERLVNSSRLFEGLRVTILMAGA